MNRPALTLLLSSCLLSFGCFVQQPALAAAPAITEFAYGLPLVVTDPTVLQVVDVPVQVWQQSRQPQLADLMVFNEAGEPVPHALRPLSEVLPPLRQPLPFFPLPGGEQEQGNRDLALRVRRDAQGAVIQVDASTVAPPGPAVAYLLDTTKLTTRAQTLELRWQSTLPMAHVSLWQSSDLSHWQPLVPKAVLADLSYNGGAVVQRTIALPGRPLPFIRLDTREPLQLEEVVALSATQDHSDQWQWLPLQGSKETSPTGETMLTFPPAPNGPTVTALQVRLPADNTLLRTVIEHQAEDKAPWVQVARADVYRLTLADTSLTNPPISCPPYRGGRWRLRLVVDNSLAGASLPQLELGWRRQQVIFLTRGGGTYTLAFGSAKAALLPTEQSSLVLAALDAAKVETPAKHLKPGPLQTLGGEQALRGDTAVPWQQYMLWTVLVAGVALLALMVRTMLRDLSKKP